jgi:TRAP-type C4-dicarboxylate transport system permease large subunit
MVLYAVSTIADVQVARLARELAPFIVILTGVLFLITYLPDLVTWLPNKVMARGG